MRALDELIDVYIYITADQPHQIRAGYTDCYFEPPFHDRFLFYWQSESNEVRLCNDLTLG